MTRFAPVAVVITVGFLVAVVSVSAGSWLSLSDAPVAQKETAPSNSDFHFPDGCATCHGETADYPVLGAKAQYLESGHHLGFELESAHAFYANGNGCQSCHTHEGFVQTLATGEVDTQGFVEWPSQPNCFTCHAPHERGDFSLRTTAPVTLVSGREFDQGEANLCATCHRARTAATDAVKETPAAQVRSHFGPHHGPQADVFMGTGAYEFEGQTYSSSQHRFSVEAGCVGCHMPLPEGRYSLSAALGGHSFNIAHGEEDEVSLNTASCVECHDGIKQLAGTSLFDTPAGADWDNDGQVEVAQAEVEGLLDRLVNPEGTGLLQQGEAPLYTVDGGFNSRVPAGVVRTEAEMAALFNYKFFGEDRSLGIHNTPYTVQVLQDTIAALDPDFDRSTRPR